MGVTTKSRRSTTLLLRPPSEEQIEHQILVYLNVTKKGFFWKNVSAGYFDGRSFRKHKSPFAINGTPDILGIIHGDFVGFEVKSAKGKPSEAQEAFKKKALSVGARVCVVRSLSDVVQALKAWGYYTQE